MRGTWNGERLSGFVPRLAFFARPLWGNPFPVPREFYDPIR